ncbi:PREDICTED: kinesin-like protein NACK1 [Brassica oleracea var. oleracea]|uniref:kinesin-like protein NACK1 n=1 Tax=Brassica oleracea var. oleracea TaxID=109376 RepID=UPI0006A6D7CF|nr:PREDICTED: kinesin-like protein NACK1 [Brassica oleracea var. oleracea]XP_013598461.1 PREDICTED: kinesin-like protein NACK1 [Brassica oleracea var. oleracea]XP_013598463.1 PREDICTED: kinesin-like protein NACK1 [Brassica oleracea var. oleracea]
MMTTEADQMQGPSGGGCEEKISVSVRLRPLNDKEMLRNDSPDWECINSTTIMYRSHLSISDRSMYPSAYSFDRVFGPECCTRQVYDQGAKEVAFSVVSGVNASVFAYGQTSSGKTYTMSGITHCTLVDIYDYIDKHKEREFILKFSAMEIYNESVRDLLSTDSSPLRLLDDPEKGTVVEKLTEETLRDWNHFKELLSVCEAQRQIGETALNEVSSRSHQILRLTVESTAREFFTNDKFSTLTATVNFIDLAGSERASQSLSAGTRLKEGCHINRSLLTLGTVIRKLSKGKTGHIPFRDSKLTRILQSSLGGNARTAIICTMSPARIHVEQSRNTLLFASCAKEVTTNAQVNVVMSDKALVKHLQRELAKLESELRSPGQPSVVASDATTALLTEKDLEVEKLKKEVFQLAQELKQARCEIEDLRRMVGEGKQGPKETLSTEVVLEHQYPKLRVRSTWDSENTTPLSPISAHRSSLSPRSSEYSYDDNVFQLSDFRIDSGSSSPFHQHAFVTPFPEVTHGAETKDQSQVHTEETEAQSDVPREPRNASSTLVIFPSPDEGYAEEERVGKETDGNSEDDCREVRCIETEMMSDVTRLHPEENIPQSSPDRFDVVNAEEPVSLTEPKNLQLSIEAEEEEEEEPVCVTEPKNIQPPTETEKEEKEEEEEEEKVKEVSSASTEPKQESKLIKTPPPCCDFKSSPDEFGTSRLSSSNPMPPVFITPSPEKPFSWLTERESQPVRSMKLTRSRSCRASVLSSSSPSWFEKDAADTPPSWYDKGFFVKAAEMRDIKNERLLQDEFSGRSMPTTWIERSLSDTQTAHATASSSHNEMSSSPNESLSRPSDVSVFELQSPSTSQEKTEETAAQKDKRIIHCSMEEIEQKLFLGLSSTKSFKDAALDPIQDYLDTPLNWPEEFKRLQREIIELWHTCNVSMAHRSYFFLLFRGDQKDCLYLEVELRRLKYIAQNSKPTDDLSLVSSTKALTRERFKLSKLMQRKLSKEERENLFLRWGIGLNTRHRRVQLAHRLWSDYKDMGHVRESASLVGKLHGFVDMNLTSSDMFGINFAFRPPRPKKSSLWKRSVLSLSFL